VRESDREGKRKNERDKEREKVCVCVCERGGKNKFVSVVSEDDSRLPHSQINILAPPSLLQTDAIEKKSTQPDVFTQIDVYIYAHQIEYMCMHVLRSPGMSFERNSGSSFRSLRTHRWPLASENLNFEFFLALKSSSICFTKK